MWHRWHSKFLSAEWVCICALKFERSANAGVRFMEIKEGEEERIKRKKRKKKTRNFQNEISTNHHNIFRQVVNMVEIVSKMVVPN